jgi:DNA-binding winged helix-turn-helix (wHTH) protein/WD40 repeat protein
MPESVYRTVHVRFRSFELDLHTRELYRNGVRLKVQGHPIDLLEMLVEHPGELVTREELRKRLWPEDTFVDFDHGLNSTIKRLRDALGDSPEHPRFIETLPRLGYRFVAEVQRDANVIPDAEESTRACDSPDDRGECSGCVAPPRPVLVDTISAPTVVSFPARISRFRWFIFAIGALFLAAGAGFYWYAHKPLPAPHIGEIAQVTRDIRWRLRVLLGTDASRIYFTGTPQGIYAAPISGGPVESIPITPPWSSDLPVDFGDVSPDGDYFLAWPIATPQPLWIFTITGKPVRYLADGRWAAWSPDGKYVVYVANGGRIYTIPSTGGQPRLLLTSKVPADPRFLNWSPEGKRIRFTTSDAKMWEVASDGSDFHEVFAGLPRSSSKWCGRWTPDGAFFILVAAKNLSWMEQSQLWVVDERSRRLRSPNPEPVQLTSEPIQWTFPLLSRDSRTIFAQGSVSQGELVRFDKRTGHLVPYLGGISADWLDFSRDGKYVAYISFPDHKVWRANRDGSGRLLLAEPEGRVTGVRWSPDGTRILFNRGFADRSIKEGWKTEVYMVPWQGGEAERVQVPAGDNPVDPTWSSDGTHLAYSVDSYWAITSRGIRIFDMETRKSRPLPPAAVPVWGPRWSPDGRYIICAADPSGFEVFDTKTISWNHFALKMSTSFHVWAHDSRSVFCFGPDGVYRISIPVGNIERVVDLKGYRLIGQTGNWLGLDPEDNPLLLRDVGTVEIYALPLERN